MRATIYITAWSINFIALWCGVDFPSGVYWTLIFPVGAVALASYKILTLKGRYIWK